MPGKMRIVLVAASLMLPLLLLHGTGGTTPPGKEGASEDSEKAKAEPKDEAKTKVKETIVKESHAGRISFPHRDHVEEYEVECENCHHPVRAKPLKTPHDHYFKGPRGGCEACHTEKKAPATEQACRACHEEIGRSRECSPAAMSTKVAVHRTCAECHELGKGKEASEACATCHSGPKQSW